MNSLAYSKKFIALTIALIMAFAVVMPSTYLFAAEGVGEPDDSPDPSGPEVAYLKPAPLNDIIDGSVYQAFGLFRFDDSMIPLTPDEIASIVVTTPADEVQQVEIDDNDPFLWFDIFSEPGEYTYLIEAHDNTVYEAIIDWSEPSPAPAAKDRLIYAPDNNYYRIYIVDVGMPAENYFALYHLKPDGSISREDDYAAFNENDQIEIAIRAKGDDGTSQPGEHVFLVNSDYNWYATTIEVEPVLDVEINYEEARAGKEFGFEVTARLYEYALDLYEDEGLDSETPLLWIFKVDGPAGPLANHPIKYPVGNDEWGVFYLDEEGVGTFGPAEGFTLAQVPLLDGVTTPFRTAIHKDGVYQVTLFLTTLTPDGLPQHLIGDFKEFALLVKAKAKRAGGKGSNGSANLDKEEDEQNDEADEAADETPAPAAPADVRDHWAAPYITIMFNRGVVQGYPDGTFRPDNHISRYELAKMLALALHLNVIEPAGDGHWADSFVAAVQNAGLMQGTSTDDFIFDGEGLVTRAQMAVIIGRLLGYESEVDLSAFSDYADVPDWAQAGFAAAVAHGLFEGYPDGSIRPNDYITRGEMSKILYHLAAAVLAN